MELDELTYLVAAVIYAAQPSDDRGAKAYAVNQAMELWEVFLEEKRSALAD